MAAREPSFHQGLGGPSLRSVLWRGITWTWGLHPVRGETRDSTDAYLRPCLAAAVTLIARANTLTDQLTAEATISCCFSLLGSYSFSSFHIRRTMAATCRAMVSLARLGLVPAEVNCR